MKRAWFGVLVAALMATPAAAREMHTFTDSAGRKLVAQVVGFSDAEVKLRRNDGKVFELKDATFSEDDQAYLKKLRNAASAEVSMLNKAAGHELFSDQPLLQRSSREVAKTLGLRAESQTSGLWSWRLYAAFQGGPDGGKPGSYRLFGAMPFSLALYSDPWGSVSHISAVYANKGDYGSAAGFAEDHFKQGESDEATSLGEAMERDFNAITARLSEALGPPETQRFGEGKERRTVSRWDAQGVSILLAMEEDEFVNLSIVPVEFAESGGKTERINDSAIKKRVAAAVQRRDNGDVVISGIPMVDQGPKGYCVPATFERAMRFMGLDADMYLLAMVGQSSAGGGTSPKLLIDEVKSQVYRKGRRTRDDEARKLSISRLKRYLDDGIPVMWTLYSLPTYNQIANDNTEARKKVEDWSAWASKVATQTEAYEDREPTPGAYHICMIIGYNETTGELAVSDSWGPRYELRWVPEGVAQWVHGGGLFMILP
ncbi:hypothetical protein [Haloferula sargassicola]|uniref:Peptidase C39-like domain-containing protein n=1 Tax=Haloferula sargassicola TaxID=490096 RepID=A0ABP9UGY6_9BACT